MEPADTLYHVTYLHSLPSIQSRGLALGRGQVFGGGYEGHSRGRLFLTDWDGVAFWFMRYGEQATHLTDDPEEGWVPIVIAVDVAGLELEEDEAGTEDSGGDSFFTTKPVALERVTALWNGREWVRLADASFPVMLAEALAAADTEEEDGETLYWMDFDVFDPEEPDEAFADRMAEDADEAADRAFAYGDDD